MQIRAATVSAVQIQTKVAISKARTDPRIVDFTEVYRVNERIE